MLIVSLSVSQVCTYCQSIHPVSGTQISNTKLMALRLWSPARIPFLMVPVLGEIRKGGGRTAEQRRFSPNPDVKDKTLLKTFAMTDFHLE